MKCTECDRRKFLKLSGQSLAAVALALPAVSLLASCGQEPLSSGQGTGSGSGGNTTGGPTVATSPNNVYTFAFAAYPQLQNAGGSMRVTINAASGAKDVYVARVSANAAETVSVFCTHQGCVINAFNASTQQFACPCHGAVFASDGTVVQGPAAVSLPSYPSLVTGSGIEVTVV